MSKLNFIDAWLIASVYQRVVDFFAKKPQWWVEQAGIALALTALLQTFNVRADWTDYVHLGVDGVCALLFIAAARVPPAFGVLAKCEQVRRFLLILTMFMLPLELIPFTKHTYALNVLQMFNSAAFLSVYYFAACRPPKPREPKVRMAPASSS